MILETDTYPLRWVTRISICPVKKAKVLPGLPVDSLTEGKDEKRIMTSCFPGRCSEPPNTVFSLLRLPAKRALSTYRYICTAVSGVSGCIALSGTLRGKMHLEVL